MYTPNVDLNELKQRINNQTNNYICVCVCMCRFVNRRIAARILSIFAHINSATTKMRRFADKNGQNAFSLYVYVYVCKCKSTDMSYIAHVVVAC